ncbi:MULTISPECIES: OmpA family protein [Psychrobacter]|uniref:OmpA family protein n=1 Tax=Psychrobacter TaxID=497 RepID=UPI00146E7843|nr:MULTISPECIES: OmpA family protein [Psychrobacter]
MTSKVYLAMGIFSVLALSACQAEPKLAADNSIKTPMPILSVNLDSDGDGVPDNIDRCPNTPLHTVVDASGCPVVVDGSGIELMFNAFFPKMSSQLSNIYESDIYETEFKKIAENLNDYPKASVFIFGHAAANEVAYQALSGFDSLSRNRALSLRNKLVLDYKIAPERIKTYDCSNKQFDEDFESIDSHFKALNSKGFESKQSRATLMVSSAVSELTNLNYDYYIKRYGGYAKYCQPFK